MDQEKTPQQSVPPGELEHLEQILRMVNEELEEAQRSVDKMDDEYKEAQQYIADSHGEGDPKEMFQTRMLMGQIDNRGASAVVYRDRLKKTKSSPYFARIDFAPQDEAESAAYYIGLYAFRFQQQLYVIDWRSPVASMFYDFELGPAHYDAPQGHTEGVAGSGKTSIALHRVAFLLYRFRNTIKAQNVTIISPNKVFGDYIAGVLPELGEEPIFEASLEDLALVQIEDGVDFVGDRDPLEAADPAWEERVKFKSTVEFVQLMDDFIQRLPQLAFQPKDFEYKSWSVPAAWIQARVDVYKRFPLLKRLEMVADDIHSRLENEFLREEEPPHRNRIFQALRKMLTMKTTLSAYRAFFRQLGKERAKLFKPFQKGVLEWNDVYPYLYLQAAFTGLQQSRLIKHLVIDEMQDYSPIQYAVLNLLFQCPKTILGDFSQSINPYSPYTLEDLHQLYEGSQLMRLEKSYRSTWEIIHFAKGIVEQTDFQAVERHGPAPELLEFSTEGEELVEICRRVEAFHQGKYNAFGIVTRTNSRARELHEKLKALGADVALITPESSSFHNGATVLSIQMSKGLEFDQVLIPQADGENYHTDFDKNLLYVACTRAMHQLDISCVGEVSPLLPFGKEK